MITNPQSGTRVDEVAPADLPHLHAGRRCVPGGLHLQPVPGRGRRAAALPHRAAADVPAGARGDRGRDAGRAAALGRLLARRGGRVRLAQRAARGRAAGRSRCAASVAAMVSVNDLADRPPRALADGEALGLGRKRVRWLDAPHLPHGWECGYLFEETTRTLLCGDLFTQPGAEHAPLTEGDILGPERGDAAGAWTTTPTPTDTRAAAREARRDRSRRRSPACTAAPGGGRRSVAARARGRGRSWVGELIPATKFDVRGSVRPVTSPPEPRVWRDT